MGIRREWLDWHKPALEQAAAWLMSRAASAAHVDASGPAADAGGTRHGALCDLRHMVCLVPGQRAGRILLAMLLQRCEQVGTQLIPPRILTPGALLNDIVRDQPLANPHEATLAWIAALQHADSHRIKPLLPHAPAVDDLMQWHDLAGTIAQLHEELAGAQLTFALVADQAERLELFGEGERWRTLEYLHALYLQALAHGGLADPHQARESAVHHRLKSGWPDAAQQIVLIGIAELNHLQRVLIAAAGDRATALVHAPQERSQMFDDFGCVVTQAWTDHPIEISSDQIISADRPEDQAQFALRAIAALDGRLSASQIAIGLGDASLATLMEHAATWAELNLHHAAGRSMATAPPCLALLAIANYLDDPEPHFADFAALLRHADIERWIWRRLQDQDIAVSDWLSLLDRYFADHLHERLADEWLGDEQTRRRLAAVHRAVVDLLSPLLKPGSQRTQRLGDWSQPILDVLASLYGHLAAGSHTPAHRHRIESCEVIRDALMQIAGAPQSLQPHVTASQAMSLLLSEIAGESLPEPAAPNQVEMLGWLELHLDPAPALIITGFNEGNIPSSETADAFLPDSLRQKLGLACNATRYARDAYLLEAIQHSREHLRIIAGRRSQRGEPLTPSRLLLMCDDSTLVHRVRVLCDERLTAAKPAAIGLDHRAARHSRFDVPDLPLHLAPREYMTITEFRSYLACPYRYALERLLKLESLDDAATELDAMQFGSLAHEILCDFGRDGEINCCDDPDKIERFLLDASQRLARQRYGRSPVAAVGVQLSRLAQRLRGFARMQADLCREGWRIRHCELHFGHERQRDADGSLQITRDTSIPLDIPGDAPMPLHGKIDRIDVNQHTGQWRIIDYKTSESATSPHRSHIGREACDGVTPDEWKDLQLPLYHYLVTHCDLKIGGDIELAYICLPKQHDGAQVKAAEWSPEQVEQAIDVARDVVRRIRAQEFPINRDFDGLDNFKRICQTSAFIEDESVEAAT